jgi:hypothetical protein
MAIPNSWRLGKKQSGANRISKHRTPTPTGSRERIFGILLLNHTRPYPMIRLVIHAEDMRVNVLAYERASSAPGSPNKGAHEGPKLTAEIEPAGPRRCPG